MCWDCLKIVIYFSDCFKGMLLDRPHSSTKYLLYNFCLYFWPLLFSVATFYCCPDLTLHPVRPSEQPDVFLIWIYPDRHTQRDTGVTFIFVIV